MSIWESLEKTKMAHLINQVIDVISKPPEKRNDGEINAIIPWLRKRTPMFHNQQEEVLKDIIRNCEYQMASHDDVILCQGERGECMFVILRGSVSVYVDASMTGEDEGFPSPVPRSASKDSSNASPEIRLGRDLDRRVFGKFIIKMESGTSFGEVALISEDSTRNASVIVDTACDFLVVGKKLFNRSLKAYEENKYESTKNFIKSHPYFNQWSARFKRLLELSLRREIYPFNSTIVKQGGRVRGMYFIVKGEANVSVEPARHRHQYDHLWPFEAGVDTYSIEFEWLRESRKNAILRRYENPATIPTKPDHVKIRRKEGCGAVERMKQEKLVSMNTVSDGEIIGDIELSMNLKTWMQTVVCTADTEVYFLDMKTYDRLVNRKNLSTVSKMKAHVIDKLKTRMELIPNGHVPLLSYLHYKLTERSLPSAKKLPPLKATKSLPDTEVQFQYLLARFREGRAPLVLPRVPGAVYYKDLMAEKARIRENVRRRATMSLAEKVRETRRAINRRKPRSRREICESLREMAEAELITFEQNKNKEDLALESFRSVDEFGTVDEASSLSVLAPSKPELIEPVATSRPELGTPLPPIREESGPVTQKATGVSTIPEKPAVVTFAENLETVKEMGTATEPHEVVNDGDNVVTISVGEDLPPTFITQKASKSKWEIPRKIVQERIQEKQSANDNQTLFASTEMEDFEDFETSETTLSFLESRIQSFHMKYADKPKMALKLPKLRRFQQDIQDEFQNRPRPGGRVWMHRRHCRFADSQIQVKGHEHVRHHMVTSLPEFESIKHTQLVVNVMMKGSVDK
ncbi:hypothetical protein LOTGIDRAFT_238088 [Lottia gigantea]|uniref:Cyclic nucleotide-binding domain-containing protein n=1 Tax=Lottia gigantea TaxID=225164 RepID=V4B879_LOTGI|nr:hypothetical protein LOTGIDRAFT_238088 [Lottia gigantea]ESP01902.1 hypothetical protein LOTGIDRAFT_238088 [Lottia gigantea]